MSDKIAKLGIERDNDLMYYIKNGDVWATPRKQKGQPKGKAQKIASAGIDLDYSKYIYFLDSDGDVARKARSLGGGRRAKPNPTKPTKPTAAPSTSMSTSAPSRKTGAKSPEQLDREIEACLAQVKKKGANGNGGNGAKNGNSTNGTKSAGKRTVKKKRR